MQDIDRFLVRFWRELSRILPKNTLQSYKDLVQDLSRSYFNKNTEIILQDFIRLCQDFGYIFLQDLGKILLNF